MKKLLKAIGLLSLLWSPCSPAETLEYLAIVFEKEKSGDVRVLNPIAVRVGPHHFKWSDMRKSSFYNDPDLYHSMADAEFWRSGKSRKGIVEEKSRRITYVNKRIHVLTSLTELSQNYDSKCISKLRQDLDRVETQLKGSQSSTAIIIFREGGKAEPSFESDKDIIVASLQFDCKRVAHTQSSVIKHNAKVDNSERSVQHEKSVSPSLKPNSRSASKQ